MPPTQSSASGLPLRDQPATEPASTPHRDRRPPPASTLILGLETSCDETAAAVVEGGRRLRSNIVASQFHLHAPYGGVVPEVAARHHLEVILQVIDTALAEAGVGWRQLDAVAVTAGPGLAGALLVGVNTAKALAYAHDLPLLGVNHLEAHLYANWIEVAAREYRVPELPALGLIVSGGHTDLVLMRDHGVYERLGRTRDDAAGEAFDKVGRLLGLGFPGGPAVERAARGQGRGGLRFPRAWLRGSDDFSFSGLKTAVLQSVRDDAGAPPVPAVAAAFQASVVDVLSKKAADAARREGVRSLLLSGGVAANGPLREALAARSPVPLFAPPPLLCTDNGAMIAACACYRFDDLRAGWDLDPQPGMKMT
ncbi:MAG: tRNA (adenosine(37)-N6)-threonylcarbamoyltransferase complex transferase subunit TsaD [Dehalococcoidia bacterium]|nr:tRNA (adenosine(37)-N6)-threonylcarbamoyltransferase complex transferase subunit TsaD [Dehalococcoidia bacterium]